MDDCSQRDPVVVRPFFCESFFCESFFCESWPGLSRPSPHSLLRRRNKDVDARDRRRPDGGKAMWSPRDAP
jgi:hypothetical protein